MLNQTLLILVYNGYPYISDCFNWRSSRPSAQCSAPGYFIEFVNILVTNLKVSVKFIDFNELRSITGNTTTNKQDLIFDALKDGTVDLISTFLSNSSIYGQGYDVTIPIYYSETKYVVAPAKKLNDIFAFFTVYDIYCWIGIFVVFVAFLGVYFLAHRLSTNFKPTDKRNEMNFGGLAWQFIRLELLQHNAIRGRLLSLNALILFFALFNCGLLIQMYNGLITTQAVRQISPKPFKDSEIFKVLKERQYSMIFNNKLQWWYQSINTSDASPFFELRRSLQNNPIRLAQEWDVEYDQLGAFTMEKLRSGKWVTILSNEMIETFRQQGYCDFIYLETNFPPQDKHLLMRKGHPLLPEINRVIMEEQISINRLYRKYFLNTLSPSCKTDEKAPKPLKLLPFYGALILLAGGLTAGAFLFCVELYRKRK